MPSVINAMRILLCLLLYVADLTKYACHTHKHYKTCDMGPYIDRRVVVVSKLETSRNVNGFRKSINKSWEEYPPYSICLSEAEKWQVSGV